MAHIAISTQTVVLVSDTTPAYVQVADHLVASLGRSVPVFQMNGDPTYGATAVAMARRADRPLVVAIGFEAAAAARKFKDKRVVYCQVFDYRNPLVQAPRTTSVAAVPPPQLLFHAWKTLDPKLARIGVITGPGLGEVVAEARADARRFGITVIHKEVRSDKEMLHVFQRMLRDIDGLWLLPDNRILSHEVITEVMSRGVRDGKQIAAFNPELFKFGAVLSFESDPADVAEQVIARLARMVANTEPISTAPQPLTRARVHTNPEVVRRFDLRLSAGSRGR